MKTKAMKNRSTFLNRTQSAIFVTLYIVGTLFLRFKLEPQLQGVMWISLAMGGFGLLLLWALIRVRFCTLDYFTMRKGDAAVPDALDEN